MAGANTARRIATTTRASVHPDFWRPLVKNRRAATRPRMMPPMRKPETRSYSVPMLSNMPWEYEVQLVVSIWEQPLYPWHVEVSEIWLRG
jgi:hypothetical protein